jgi:hypothetical protein
MHTRISVAKSTTARKAQFIRSRSKSNNSAGKWGPSRAGPPLVHMPTPRNSTGTASAVRGPITSQVHTCGAGKQRQGGTEGLSQDACTQCLQTRGCVTHVRMHRHHTRGHQAQLYTSAHTVQDTKLVGRHAVLRTRQAACTAATCMQARLRVTHSSCSVLYTKGPDAVLQCAQLVRPIATILCTE